MPFTDAPGFRMHYEVAGEGDPLLLVNGLGSDLTEWLHQIPAFSARFRVIAFDNRGAGKSEAPPGPYATARMADDAATLLDALQVPKAHLLGVSLGGMIAQQIAIRHPGKVNRLVLACTAPGGALSVRPSPEALAAFAPDPSAGLEAQIRRTIPWLYTEEYCRTKPEEVEAFVRRRLASPADEAGVAAQLAAAIGHDAGGHLGTIHAPTLVITGAKDLLVPPENSRRIAERIPGSRLVVLPRAPHRLFAENAEEFNGEVLSFLIVPNVTFRAPRPPGDPSRTAPR